MKVKKQEVVDSLLASLAPQLSAIVPAGQKPPKSLLKTVSHLAEQLIRLRAKQEKRAAKAASPTPKETRQKLTDELVAVLDAHFAEDVLAEQETMLLTETAEELAAKLTKLRNKQTSKAKKQVAPDASEPEAEGVAQVAPTTKRISRPKKQAAV